MGLIRTGPERRAEKVPNNAKIPQTSIWGIYFLCITLVYYPCISRVLHTRFCMFWRVLLRLAVRMNAGFFRTCLLRLLPGWKLSILDFQAKIALLCIARVLRLRIRAFSCVLDAFLLVFTLLRADTIVKHYSVWITSTRSERFVK